MLSSVIQKKIAQWLKWVFVISFFVNLLLLASPLYMLQIYDRVLVSRSLPTLVTITAITVLLIAAYGALDFVRGRILLRASLQLERQLGWRILDRLFDFGLTDVGNINRAEAIRDAAVMRGFISSPQLTALFDMPWVPLYTLLIFGFSWVLGVVALAGMVLLVGLALLDERFTYKAYSRAQQRMARAGQFASYSVANAELTNVLGMKQAVIHLWLKLLDEAAISLKQASDNGSLIASMTRTVRILIQVVMLGLGAYLIITDNLPPGVMIASTIIVARAVGPVEALLSGWRSVVDARNAYVRIESLLERRIHSGAGMELPALRGGVRLEDAYYAFEAGKPLLSHVTLDIHPGEVVGIVGPSGAGKSTLARMILGVVRPMQGRVLLDGYDVVQYLREVLGPQLGYLPQNIELYPGTIAQNISRMDEAVESSEEALAAASMVGLDQVVGRLTAGFDTVLGEQGQNLSGGQRQLVALARAFYKQPRLVVLDEPDASLDQASEEKLLNLIDAIRNERRMTLIVVSHSPRLIGRMDRLLLVKDGAVNQLVRNEDRSGVSTVLQTVRRSQ